MVFSSSARRENSLRLSESSRISRVLTDPARYRATTRWRNSSMVPDISSSDFSSFRVSSLMLSLSWLISSLAESICPCRSVIWVSRSCCSACLSASCCCRASSSFSSCWCSSSSCCFSVSASVTLSARAPLGIMASMHRAIRPVPNRRRKLCLFIKALPPNCSSAFCAQAKGRGLAPSAFQQGLKLSYFT